MCGGGRKGREGGKEGGRKGGREEEEGMKEGRGGGGKQRWRETHQLYISQCELMLCRVEDKK